MIKKSINLTLFAIFLMFTCKLSAQVTAVKMRLVYNDTTCWYDAYIHIISGTSIAPLHRAQFNSSYSIVAKTGLNIQVAKRYMPLKNNQLYNGVEPYPWEITSSIISPAAQPENDFFYFATSTLGTYYDDLYPGDSIRLFSLKILNPGNDCGQDLRLFINGQDPTSNDPGMNNADFSQGFTIGGGTQDYTGNLPQIYPKVPTPEADINCGVAGINLDLSPIDTSCHSPYTFQWTGPGISGTSTSEDIVISTVNSANNGTYTLVVSDDLGCTASFQYNLENNPSAGADQSACSGTSATLNGSGASGDWIQASTNPSAVVINSPSSQTTTVDFPNDAEGIYKFYYQGLNCTDSVEITVSKHNAGNNPAFVTCYEDGIAILAAEGVGTWSLDPLSDGTATISPNNNPNATVTDFSNAGTYLVNWINGTCEEQITITVGDICACPIDDNTINDPASTSFCNQSPNVLITGPNPIPAGGTYLWEYSTDGVNFVPANGTNTNINYTTGVLSIGEHYFRRYYTTTSGILCSIPSNNIVITVHDNPVVTLDAVDPMCIDGGSLTLSALPAGGTFSGDGVGTSSGIFNSSDAGSGNHVIIYTYTDNNNCSNSATTTINVKDKPSAPQVSNDGPKCIGETINLTSDLIANANYTWTGPNGFSSTLQNAEVVGINDLKAGDYDLILEIDGCYSDVATTTVAVKQIPDAPAINNDGPACFGDDIQLNAENIANADYFWTGPNGFTANNDQYPDLLNVDANDSGEYIAWVVVDGCISGQSTTNVLVKAKPAAPVASNDSPKCPGENINLMASDVSGATYQWVGPSYSIAAQNPTLNSVTSLQSGVYKVVAIIDNCASDTASTVVTVKPTPVTPAPTNNGPVCQADTLQLNTATIAGASYEWSGPDGYMSVEQNPTIDFMTTPKAGDYKLKITIDGCESAEGITTVVVKDKPSLPTASNDGPKCIGEDITLSTPNVPGAMYSWRGLATSFTSTLQNPVLENVTPLNDGEYWVKVIINGCESDESQTNVVVKPKPATPVANNDGPKCTGEDITLSTAEVVGANYIWTGPNGLYRNITTNTTVIAAANAANVGEYKLWILSGGCLSDSATTTVAIKATPATPIASNDGPKCEGETINLSTPLVANATYEWSSLVNGFNDTQRNPQLLSATPALNGIYNLKVTVDGCESATASTTVTVKPKPATPTVSNDGPKCIGEDILLSTLSVNGASYEWTGPNTYTQQNPTINNATTADGGEYKLIITVDGCESDEAATTVVINDKPIVTLDPVSVLCDDASPVVLVGNPNSGTYNGNGVSGNLFDPADAKAGTHVVSYTYTDNNNCTNEAIINIEVQEKPEAIISSIDQLCEGAADVPLFASPTGGEFSGEGVITASEVFKPSLLTPDIYTIKYSWTDNVCSAEATLDVEIRANPIVSIDEVGQICVNAAEITLNATPNGGIFSGSIGIFGENFNPTIAGVGTHTITYTYQDGNCFGYGSIDIEVTPEPIAGIDAVSEICEDANDIILTGFPSGIVFSGSGVNVDVFSPSLVGNGDYTITGVYDDNLGCVVEATTIISVKEKPTVTINNIGEICETETEIVLTGNPSGGTFSGAYTFDDTKFDVTGAKVGSHTVTYNYNDGVCSYSATAIVEVVAKPVITIDPVGQICEEADRIDLTASPANGLFTGDGVEPGNKFNPNGLSFGNHEISYTVTEGNCVTTEKITIEVVPAPIVTIDAVADICIDGATVNLTGSPFSGTFSGPGVSGFTFNASIAGIGDHTITYTFDDNIGCVVEATEFISVKAKPIVTIDPIADVCETATEINLNGNQVGGIFSGNHVSNNKFDVTAAGIGSHPITYSYNDGICSNETSTNINVIAKPVITIDEVGQICEDADEITLQATPIGMFGGDGVSGNKFDPNGLTLGNHTITYTVTSGACTSTESINIEVVPAPIVSIDAVSDLCVDGSIITLNASPANGTYSGTGVTNTNQFNPANAGIGDHTITYTFNDNLGCIVSASTVASVKVKPIVSVLPIADACETTTEITLVGNPSGGTFTGSNVLPGDKFDVLNAGVGTHTVTYTYSDGICSNTAIGTVNVIAKPSITIDEVGQICKDASPRDLTATSSAIGTFSGMGVSGNKFNPSGLTIGNHIVSYTVTSGACTSTESITIEVVPAPIVNIDAVDDVCIDGSIINLNATPLNGTYSGTGVVNINQFNPANAGIGDHTITYTFNDNLGCIVSATTVASVKAKPIVSILPIPDVCETTTEITLVGNPTGGTFSGNNVNNNDKFNVSTAGVGTHPITYSYSDGVCSNSANGSVNVTSEPIIDFTEVGQICKEASPITLQATPALGLFSGNGVSGNKFNPATLSIGNHTVSYTVTSGACTSTESITIEVVPAPVVAIDAVQNVCIDGAVVALNASPIGGDFSGNAGVSGTIFNPSIAGTGNHTITYTFDDNLGCVVSEDIQVTVENKPTVVIDEVGQICQSSDAVNLTANLSPGTFSGSAAISGTSFDPKLVTPGMHTINYLYDNGVCSNTASINIEVMEQVNAGNDIVVSCAPLASTIVILNATGNGTWSQTSNVSLANSNENSKNPVISGFTQPGAYTFEYSNGVCKDEVSLNISAKPNAGSDISGVRCFTTSQAVLAGTGNGTWSLISNGHTADFDVNNPSTTVSNFSIEGQYTFVWTVDGCTDTVNINVGKDCLCPIDNNLITNPNPKEFCDNTGSITIDGGVVSLPGIYKWQYSLNTGAFADVAFASNTNRTITFSNLGIGNHRFRRLYETTSGVICADTSNIVSLDVKSKPSIIGVSSNSPVCSGEELNITALDVPGTTYKWFDNNGIEINAREINIPLASEINEGTYRLYITRDNCISDEISLNVVVNDKPATPVIEPIAAICEGENLSFNTNTVAEEYQWTFNGNAVGLDANSFDIFGADLSDAGNYQLTVSNLGCESDPATVNVLVNAKPAKPVLNSNSPVCEGQNLSITYVNNIPGVAYQWSTPNGPVNTKDINITSANSSHDGDYTLFVTKDGCTSESTTVNVEVSAKFAAPAILGDITVCEGENIELTTDAVGADYEWTLPNGSIVISQIVSITNATKSIHEGPITLKISKNGCESEVANAAIVINANPAKPSIDPIAAICEGEILSFNSSTIADSYEWYFNSTIKNTNKSFDELSADESDEGVYSLVVTINGCKSQPATVTTVINEIPAKPILNSNSPVCEGQSISIILTNNVAGLTYDWTLPGGTKLTTRDINITIANSSHDGDYTLTVSKDNCVSEPTTINVEVSSKFSAPTIIGDVEICEGESTTLSTGADATAYEWVTPKGTFTTPTIQITNATLSDAGIVTLKISKDGCESEVGNAAVIVNSKPLAPVIDPVSPVCEGETLSFNTSTIADSYSWKVNGIEKSNNNSFEILDANINDAVTYTLVVTKDGCESNPSNITAIVKEAPAKPTINSNSPVCEGQTITIVHTNNEVGYNHFWTTPSGNPTTKDISIASANSSHEGDYVLYVENNGCRSESTTITVDVSDKSQAPTIVGQLDICEGQPINLSTSNVADSYVWTLPNSTTSTNPTIDILSATAANAGTYKLEIEKDGCKSEIQQVIVSINTKLTAPSIDPVAAVCEGEDIIISAEFLAGATYTWTGPNNFNGQTHTISNAKLSDVGTYTLIVDKDGCKSEAATINIDVKETPAKPTINSNSPVCEGQTISIVHTNNEVGFDHFWVIPGGAELLTKDISIASANSSHEGDYVLYVEKDGCKSVATTITVDVSDKSQAPTIEGQLEICEGQAINLSTSNAADNYTWTLPNSTTLTNSTIDISGATTANAGKYTLEIEKDGCRSEVGEVTVIVNAKLSAPTIDPINAVCEGEDITLTTSTIADSYEWTFNGNKIPGSSTITLNNSDLNDVGTYSLSVTKDGCKSEIAAINVEVKEKPEAAILNDNKVCEGTPVTIANSSTANGVTYEWTLPNGSKVTDPSILINSSSAINEGTYSLVLSNNGCKSEPESMVLTVNELPVTSINGDLEYCEGERITLASSNTSSLSYNWNGPDNLKETTSTIAINNADVSNSGSYSIQVTNTITGCVSSPIEVEVTVNAKPVAPAISAEAEVCAGKEILLTTEEVINAEYSWTGPDGFKSDLRNPVILKATEEMEGSYELIITLNGCPSEPVSLAISIKNCSCNIADNEITSDLAAFCNESGKFTIEASTPSPANGIFEWQYKDDKSDYSAAIGVNDQPNYEVENLGLGKHFFRRIYTIENEGYICTDTAETLEINVLDNSTDYIDLFLDPKTPCVGDTMTILIQNEVPGVAYTWAVVEDDMSIVASNNRLAQFSPDRSGKYHIQVTQQIPGCNESDPLVQEINVNANPRVNLGNDTVFCSLDGEYELNLEDDFALYTWSDGSENSNLTIDTKGTYTVTVTDENGCEGIDEIRIKEFCCKIYYPNIVNMAEGAVKNNEFKLVDNGCVLSSKLRIYDRWGNLVYNSNSGLEPWNGLFKGKPVEQGVYAFIFTYTALDEDDEEFTGKLSGDVTILR